MLSNLDLPEGLYPALKAVCETLPMPITIADPNQFDTPLIYVNHAFEQLTQYKAEEVIGHSCRFLQGPLTDRTITNDLAVSCQNRTPDSCCLINYRKDGSVFFNLLALEPIYVDRTHTMLMGCQFAFDPIQVKGTMARTSAFIDHAQRHIRLNTATRPQDVSVHDTYRLDAISMRFEAAFNQVRNTLIKNTNDRMLEELCTQPPSD